ncbi:MAG: hypothetical protein K0U28_08170 [Cyanobacteria bacterium]|nr:hypothetical protein [Cyanobacteriota bacterium]
MSSNKKRAREKKTKTKSKTKTKTRKRRRKNAVDALDPTIAMIATIALSLVHVINPTVATSSGRRERKLDNGKHFRDWKIPLKDFLANPKRFGVKILEELKKLGGNSRAYAGRVDNRVFRCVTCGHSDYEDGMIVYAIVIQEKVAGSCANPPYVYRIKWVSEYGIRILREYDRRIIAEKDPKAKTAYAVVKIPIEGTGKGGKTRRVYVHALLFNKKEGRGPFLETDHIENSDEATNGLNNLLANVRDGAPDGTRRLNNINRSTRKDNTSGHKGVFDYKGSNEGGSDEEFGSWLAKYEEFNKVTKQNKRTSKSFRRIKNGAAHKQKKFKEACEFEEEKTRKYVDDLEEYYKPIRALHDRWFSVGPGTQDVVRSFERHWHALRPSILELTRTSK